MDGTAVDYWGSVYPSPSGGPCRVLGVGDIDRDGKRNCRLRWPAG